VKSFLKAVLILGTLFVAYCVAASSFLLSTFAPDEGVDSFAKLKEQGVPWTKARRVSNPPNHICVFGDIGVTMWTLPSGPPAYLFDASGRLIDFTVDVGDSTKFQSEYLVFEGTELSIAEVETLFENYP